LKFIGRLVSGELFAQTFSNSFEVSYGDPYKLGITSFMGVAFGGSPFSSNPIVSIVDRGDNVVASVNHGVIKAVLTTTPYNASKVDALQPTEKTIVNIINGSAVFEGMFINRAGYPYQITFESIAQVSSQRYDELYEYIYIHIYMQCLIRALYCMISLSSIYIHLYYLHHQQLPLSPSYIHYNSPSYIHDHCLSFIVSPSSENSYLPTIRRSGRTCSSTHVRRWL